MQRTTEPTSTAARPSQAARWFLLLAWLAVAAFCIIRFLHLTVDFPNNSPWNIDQAKFTDEGWWASGAIAHHLLGHWTVSGDYNPVVAVPVWPALLGLLFHFTGVSVVATRALNVLLSVATLGVVFALVRRCARNRSAIIATLAVLLLACSPFAYAFSRLATLETIVAFEFCLLLLLATFASDRRILLIAMPALITAMALTKTTSIVLLPAIFWLAWQTTGGKLRGLLPAAIAVVMLPAILFKTYVAILFHRGFAADYHYFFTANNSYEIDWNSLFSCICELLRQGFWVDRMLYPAMLVALLYALFRKRGLWRNPLFTASCLALAGQTIFLLGLDGDVAPRYLFLTLFPMIFIVALTLETFRGRIALTVTALLVLATLALNSATLVDFQRQRTSNFMQAANSIRDIVNHDASHNHLLLGISASQISLMTGLPSINDTYGTEPLPEKVLRYQPGWYVAWTGIGPDQAAALAPFHIEEAARFHVFNDDDRNTLILYRLDFANTSQTDGREAHLMAREIFASCRIRLKFDDGAFDLLDAARRLLAVGQSSDMDDGGDQCCHLPELSFHLHHALFHGAPHTPRDRARLGLVSDRLRTLHRGLRFNALDGSGHHLGPVVLVRRHHQHHHRVSLSVCGDQSDSARRDHQLRRQRLRRAARRERVRESQPDRKSARRAQARRVQQDLDGHRARNCEPA